MRYDPFEKFAEDNIAHCELCTAWPPNAYSEAYGSGSSYVCRACGMKVCADTPACGMFLMDERIKAKVDAFKEANA